MTGRKPSQKPTGKGITIETVAEDAGVSTMTVSRVLRDTGNVTESTRARVAASMEKIGYVHNRLAGALASAQSTQIAVIVPTLQSIVFTELLAGVAATLDSTDLQPVIGITEYDLQRELELVKSMLAWRPAAFILANIYHLEQTSNILKNANIPVVEVMALTRNPIDICVGLNQWSAGSTMAKHLLEKGYRRFGYLGTDLLKDRSAAKRLAGFTNTIEKGGASLCAQLTMDEASSVSLGRDHMEDLLAMDSGMDAVYFSNDAVAAGAMMYCMKKGINIPGDLALASFSGLDIAAAMPLPLTTIKSPRYTLGQLSAKRIISRINGEKSPRITDAGFEFIEGESS